MPQAEAAGKLALVLFGPPGSGKGTQAKGLRECLGLPHISTGDMLREHILAGDSIGLEVKSLMQAGRLVPDELVNRLVSRRIDHADCARGFILDGYPRTIRQAGEMEQMLEARGIRQVVIHLQVDYNRIIARLTGRRQCPVCGTLYSLSAHPPKTLDVCDLDGAKLVIRDDDREGVIRERLEEYERQTRPLLDHFRASGRAFYTVDASDDPPAIILKRICGLVKGQ